MLLAVILLILSSVAAAAGRRDGAPGIDRLAELILLRLDLAEPVAAWKWRHGKPIEDLAQEQRILDAAADQARAAGLDEKTARSFLAAQMAASKAAQRRWFARWKARGFPATEPDLDLAIMLRPSIACYGDAIIAQLALVRSQLDRPAPGARLSALLRAAARRRGLAPAVLDDIAKAARGVRLVTGGASPALPQSTPDCSPGAKPATG